MRTCLCLIFLFISTTSHATTWWMHGEEKSPKTGQLQQQLSMRENMEFSTCKKWALAGASPMNLHNAEVVTDLKMMLVVAYENGIRIACQNMGKGQVLLSGPKEQIESLNLDIKK